MIGLKRSWSVWGWILVGMACLARVQSAQPFLTKPAVAGGLFSLDLLGESKTDHVIERTTNWNMWIPVWTNQTVYPSVHHAAFSMSSDHGFFRARQLPASLFRFAVVSPGAVHLNGYHFASDSFDSSDPLYSTEGAYDPTHRLDQGDVAVREGITNGMATGGVEVRGHILTMPGAPLDIGDVGAVGGAAWIDAGTPGIQPGFGHQDLNLELSDNEPPFSGGVFSPVAGIVDGRFYAFVLGEGSYQMAQLNLSGNQAMMVTGRAVLYVTGNLILTGSAAIEIREGAQLALYVGGPSTILSGGGLINHAKLASAFLYYGLPENTNVVVEPIQDFAGVIWAPQADLTLGSGANGVTEIAGACAARSIRLKGNVRFHYDEALGRMVE